MTPLMSILAIPFPDIDPVAFQIGPIAIKWYGLAYLAGLLLGWLYIRRLLNQPKLWAGGLAPFVPEKVDDLLIYVVAGVLLGGRLGFVLFYEPSYYLENPLDVLAVWKGGMSFHGGFFGSGVAIWIFSKDVCRKYSCRFLVNGCWVRRILNVCVWLHPWIHKCIEQNTISPGYV